MRKKIISIIILVLTPIILATAISFNVNATLGRDDSWEIKAGDVSYKNAKGEIVAINGVKFIDGALGNKYEFPGANNKGVEFKIEKTCTKNWESGSGNHSATVTDWCLVPYNQGKRLTEKGKGVEGMIGKSAVNSKTKVIDAMVSYLKNNGGNIPNVTEVAKKDKNGNFKWEKADGKGETDEGDDENSDDPNCYDGGGAIGWVLCPIILKASEDITDLYEKAVEPSLQIESSLIFGDSGQEGTAEAWTIFRNIANLIFIAMFLFVIFSQLTGIGIDNYGVKKALPKLVVMAVLINLSFIICALAVDVSNLLGYGFKEMLFNIADQITVAYPPEGANGGNGVLWGVAIAGAIGTGLAVWANPAIVVTAFISIVAAFISILFLFILLSVRKAAVVLLVAVSPVAIALYSLPNTKSIFDKWFGLFKAMLIVFPTVGLLIGGGQLASAVILTANNGEQFFLWFVGMIVSLAPIFLVPSIVRGSMNAFGSVGARLAGLGGVLSGRARAGMTNSRLNQAAQSLGDRRVARRRAGVKFVKDENGKLVMKETARGRIRTGIAKSKVPLVNRLAGEAQGRDRRAFLKQYQDEGMVERYNSINAMKAAHAGITKGLDEQELNDAIINMAGETKNYDADTMQGLLRQSLNDYEQDVATYGENSEQAKARALKVKALMSKMSESSYATKLMAGVMSDGTKTEEDGTVTRVAHTGAAGRKLMANTLAKSSSINAAVSKSDGAAAQYMREINSGATDANVSFGYQGDANGWYAQNGQRIFDKVTDDDVGFAGQSDHAVERAFDYDYVPQDVAIGMSRNEQIRRTATRGTLQVIDRRAGRTVPNPRQYQDPIGPPPASS